MCPSKKKKISPRVKRQGNIVREGICNVQDDNAIIELSKGWTYMYVLWISGDNYDDILSEMFQATFFSKTTTRKAREKSIGGIFQQNQVTRHSHDTKSSQMEPKYKQPQYFGKTSAGLVYVRR